MQQKVYIYFIFYFYRESADPKSTSLLFRRGLHNDGGSEAQPEDH